MTSDSQNPVTPDSNISGTSNEATAPEAVSTEINVPTPVTAIDPQTPFPAASDYWMESFDGDADLDYDDDTTPDGDSGNVIPIV